MFFLSHFENSLIFEDGCSNFDMARMIVIEAAKQGISFSVFRRSVVLNGPS
jgi:hypothetical protein